MATKGLQGIFNKFPIIIEFVVFVWSQYDGGNIDKRTMAEVPSKTKRCQAKWLWEETSSNPSANANPMIDYITSVIVPYSLVA